MSVLRFDGNNQCQAPQSGRQYFGYLDLCRLLQLQHAILNQRQKWEYQGFVFFTSNHYLGMETISKAKSAKRLI